MVTFGSPVVLDHAAVRSMPVGPSAETPGPWGVAVADAGMAVVIAAVASNGSRPTVTTASAAAAPRPRYVTRRRSPTVLPPLVRPRISLGGAGWAVRSGGVDRLDRMVRVHRRS